MRFKSTITIYLEDILRYTGHSALKYVVNKPVLGGHICRWLLLFQKYEFEVFVKLGRLNARPDHLS